MFSFQTTYPGVGSYHEHLTSDWIWAIADGYLGPGDKLPTGKQVKAAYGYSPSVVGQTRRTLKTLRLADVVSRAQGAVVLQGAAQLARQLVREGKHVLPRQRGSDVEVARPTATYTREEPIKSRVALNSGVEYSMRWATEDERNAGLYFDDELVVDAVHADGTTESYGIFHTIFKLP
jgi:DNA-binding transcriptional MocR family regulator